MAERAPTRSRANRKAVPAMKRGRTSFRYHSSRATVFTTTLESRGNRRGGSSWMKSEPRPGSTRDAR